MMKLVREKKIDKVLVWEASRISRVSLEAAKIIAELNENKVSLYIKNYNLETLDKHGNIDPMAKFMLAILNEFSENERLNIKMRLKSGYDRHRSQGGIVGRRSGTSENRVKFLEKHLDAVKLLKKGISIRNVARLTGKSTKTVQKIRNHL
jgi:DNA invertase Pin-like site-specific DNA recombinase